MIPKKPDFMNGDYVAGFKRMSGMIICTDVRIHSKDLATRATATQRRALVKYISWFYTELAKLGSVDAMRVAYPNIFPKNTR
jgi:2-phosphoglycerate kinase